MSQSERHRSHGVLVSSEQQKRQQERLQQDTPQFIQACLLDPHVIEIMGNPDGTVWMDHLVEGLQPIGTMASFQTESLLNVIASIMETSITRENPILECELPYDGSRFAAMIPPVVESPVFSIRRKAIQVFSLEDYVSSGIMTEFQRQIITQWVLERKNIVIAGGTSSGKTTLMNGVIDEIVQQTPQHRLIVLEDTVELQCKASNTIAMRSSREVSLQMLVKAILRHRPDRIIVGEVRGKEVFDLLTAWSTGHPGGIASVHANSASSVFLRLEQLLELATQSSMKLLIGEAVDAIIYIEKTATGRKVKTLLSVSGYDGYQYVTEEFNQ